MKVILLKNIKELGKIGEIKEVSEGYARNFLLPQKLAEPATDSNIKRIKVVEEKKIKMAEVDLVLTEKIAEQLSGQVVNIEAKANEDGKYYAAISPTAIIKKLKEKGFEIKKDQITLIEPIKEVGEYPVTINLDHGLEAEITVITSIKK